MYIKDLCERNMECNVVILQTPSDKMRVFIQDLVKRKYRCNMDTTISCQSKKDYKQIRDIMNIVPSFSDRWYIEVNLDICNDKELVSLIKDATTCVFFCKVSKYATYKKFKGELKQVSGVLDFYITYLKKADFIFVYDSLVPKDNRMTKQLTDYVMQSYGSEIDSVFDLCMELANGREVKTRKDISDICGIGGNSTESFVISLLKEPPVTDKGLKIVMRNRLRAGKELCDSMDYNKFKLSLRTTIKSFIQIKVLLISGVVYKQIRKLPEGYNEKVLCRYQRYVWRLKEIPLSRLLRLYQALGNQEWKSDLDLMRFIYSYITVEEVKSIK